MTAGFVQQGVLELAEALHEGWFKRLVDQRMESREYRAVWQLKEKSSS